MRAIDGEPLYEKACDLEAQALAYVIKIANDETKIEEWRIWSAILVERTAFKQDIFDAPEVKQRCEECETFNKTRLLIPQPERKKGKWINIREGNRADCDQCGQSGRVWMNFCFSCGSEMEGQNEKANI